MLIPHLPDVEPAPTQTYHSTNRGTRNVYIRRTDLEKFGHTAGCRAGSPMSGQEHTAECRKRLEDVMTTDASTSTRVKANSNDPGDLDGHNDPQMEDPLMNSLAKLWHRENDPDDEVDLLILQQRDRYVASVHETGGDKPVCEEPKTLFFPHTMSAVGITSMTRVLSRRQELRKFRSFVNLVSGRWWTDPVTRLCLAHGG